MAVLRNVHSRDREPWQLLVYVYLYSGLGRESTAVKSAESVAKLIVIHLDQPQVFVLPCSGIILHYYNRYPIYTETNVVQVTTQLDSFRWRGTMKVAISQPAQK